MFVKVYIVLSIVFSLHHASMALTRSPPSQHSLPCGSSLPRFLPAPWTWPHGTQDHPRYPSHGHPICKRKLGDLHTELVKPCRRSQHNSQTRIDQVSMCYLWFKHIQTDSIHSELGVDCSCQCTVSGSYSLQLLQQGDYMTPTDEPEMAKMAGMLLNVVDHCCMFKCLALLCFSGMKMWWSLVKHLPVFVRRTSCEAVPHSLSYTKILSTLTCRSLSYLELPGKGSRADSPNDVSCHNLTKVKSSAANS